MALVQIISPSWTPISNTLQVRSIHTGEIAGLHWKNIDFDKRVLKIQEVLVWIHGTPKVKSCPKNGLSREVYLNDTLVEILRRRSKSKSDSGLVFDFTGKSLRYRIICNNFNRAWRKAGVRVPEDLRNLKPTRGLRRRSTVDRQRLVYILTDKLMELGAGQIHCIKQLKTQDLFAYQGDPTRQLRYVMRLIAVFRTPANHWRSILVTNGANWRPTFISTQPLTGTLRHDKQRARGNSFNYYPYDNAQQFFGHGSVSDRESNR
ncbi:MAG: tyrosine-type recombinase/integrase [Bdellovibrionaceae bacterium]|nr:tyrosine-type recombinase/integrase [Pseudobdellovibrionaceae bacterium]